MHKDFKIKKDNIHRLMFIAIMVAVKWHDNVDFKNSFYSKISGINNKEINYMEVLFLETID